MEDQQTQQQTLTAEGLNAFYAEFGAKAHAVHELAAQLRKMGMVGQQLMDAHAPGKCQPIQAEGAPPVVPETNGHEPTALAAVKRRPGG